MSDCAIYRTKGDDFYAYMEQGRPVCTRTSPAIFSEAEAPTIVEQLLTFEGDGAWIPLKIVAPEELLAKCGTTTIAAQRIGCSVSTIKKWRAQGRITFPYMRAANAALVT